jgi:hypothetical protein
MATPAAFANSIVLAFTNLPATLENESYGSSGATYNGYITTTINGSAGWEVICDDYYVTTHVNSQPDAYDYSLIGSTNWASTVAFETGETITNKTGSTVDGLANNGTISLNETQAYETAAVLLVTLSKISNPSADTITDYQYALWNLFDSGLVINANQLTDQINAADIVTSGTNTNKAITAADASELVIYTANPVNSNQEMLGLSTPTPEPGSWMLMLGLGLMLLSRTIRTRARSRYGLLLESEKRKKYWNADCIHWYFKLLNTKHFHVIIKVDQVSVPARKPLCESIQFT